jgi:hypothetical protein
MAKLAILSIVPLSLLLVLVMPQDPGEYKGTVMWSFDTNSYYTPDMMARWKKVLAKRCAPPLPHKDVETLKRYDACGLSTYFGRTNVRDCFTTQCIGFKVRVTLEQMYEYDCKFDDIMNPWCNHLMIPCLVNISAITPKQEFKDIMTQASALKGDELKKFNVKLLQKKLSCEEKAFGLR